MSVTVFDLDDLCDRWDPYEELVALKERVPQLKVTLFAIPYLCSDELLEKYGKLDWVELGLHGYHHATMECAAWSYEETREKLKEVSEWWPGAAVFKAPGWVANEEVYRALRDEGWAVADNAKHQVLWGNHNVNRYVYNDALSDVSALHGHTWDTCGNGPSSWSKWEFHGEFKTVSDVCEPTKDHYVDSDVIELEYKNSPIHGVLKNEKPEKGSLFVDLGSYTGAEIQACREAGMEVMSFEPHPTFSELLKKRHGNDGGVQIIPSAAWVSNEKVALHENDPAMGMSHSGSSLVSEKYNVQSRALIVDAVDVAEELEGLDIRILKMNVEGAEWKVMERILETIGFDRIRAIYIEDHDKQIKDPDWVEHRKSVIEKLRSAGVEWRWWA